ncbi:MULTISPECIES: MFS transporter [Pseudomonas]|jgi:MFS family permease|uniref:MFS transporter n=1 Tax=Pseudomonas TaxID=286 RepID=UPI0005C18149|nr:MULTISPECIES: MFS transporter [Pseudomonas]KIU54105.1 MFS transporter [Pseudomonas putida]MBG8560752.1 MFS transporter [Pseudomonas qingdaonensis]MCP8347144.1 MFS transporter [Pseudomonas sp. FBF18]MCQ0165559.1 MFS transporter [Pseudomonas sp. S12(2018)]MDD1957440.1 MFS transporter [Pseudomonas sp. 8209]
MLESLRGYGAEVRLLLCTTFVLTLARAITLPYLVVYLSEHFALGISAIGLMIGGALIVGSLLSLYGGYLIDTLRSYTVIVFSTLAFALAFFVAVASRQLGMLFACLVVINLTLAVVDIAAKAGFCALLPVQARGEVFSIKYTLSNVAYAVGPFVGVALVLLDDRLPFVLSALLGLGMCLSYQRRGERAARAGLGGPTLGLLAVGRHLLGDRRLVYFTLGGALSAVVFGQFTAYLSQYLVTTTSAIQANQTVSYLVATNAITVIALQYAIGRRIGSRQLMPWLLAGMLLFVIGLLGFSLAQTLWVWCLAMLVFTLGEIIVIPAEYMFIDSIAPEHLRGVYYGAQNLSNLGAALGPVLCGFALAHLMPTAMFYLMMLSVGLAGLFYCLGARRQA